MTTKKATKSSPTSSATPAKKRTATAARLTNGNGARKESATDAASAKHHETSSDTSYDDIARRAWEIWLSEGCPAGKDVEHWLRAEAEMRN